MTSQCLHLYDGQYALSQQECHLGWVVIDGRLNSHWNVYIADQNDGYIYFYKDASHISTHISPSKKTEKPQNCKKVKLQLLSDLIYRMQEKNDELRGDIANAIELVLQFIDESITKGPTKELLFHKFEWTTILNIVTSKELFISRYSRPEGTKVTPVLIYWNREAIEMVENSGHCYTLTWKELRCNDSTIGAEGPPSYQDEQTLDETCIRTLSRDDRVDMLGDKDPLLCADQQ